MKVYKLTNQNMTTYENCKWELGVPKETDGTGDLCSEGWLHYYTHPLLAVLLNPIHANISNPKLFEAKAEGQTKDDKGLKGGCTKLTLIKEIELPIITTTQKVIFAILCSLVNYKEPTYIKWATDWIDNKDRSKTAAAHAYAYTAAVAAYAYAAAAAADANADAAAAHAAVYAAAAAVYAAKPINLMELAEQAMNY